MPMPRRRASRRPAKDAGLFIFDSFKQFDGKTYVALNNFPGGQNALALVHDDLATFEVSATTTSRSRSSSANPP